MPRAAAVTPDQIEQVFQKINPFKNNGDVAPRADKLWKKANLTLKNAVSAYSLYFYIFRNWKDLKTKLTKF